MGADELTPAEVAREFNVSPATVRRWEESGVLAPTRRLPGSGHRRYSRAAVDALKAKIEADSTASHGPSQSVDKGHK
jgi:excisionase family DNA binding protein